MSMATARYAEHALAPERLRVMVVDDAVVVRGMLARWIKAEHDLEIVASMRGGREALEQVEQKDPDVVVLDVTMPDMDGLTALPRLLHKKPNLVVLMVSTLTRRNAEISLHALSLGAADYIAKPQTDREFASSESFRRELIDKIRVLGLRAKERARAKIGASVPELLPDLGGQGGHDTHRIARGAGRPEKLVLRPFPPTRPRVLLIGSSTGGPQALNAILGAMGRVIDTAPVLIAQHMPATFTAILAEHLARLSGRPAAEAVSGELIRAGQIYIAPGGRHMRVTRCDGHPFVLLDDGPPVNFCKPSVDPLFTSAAAVWGPWNLALILTGMGVDGARGAAQIVTAGGCVIAQDEASSVVWGMPGSVAQAGLASAVLPLDQIGPKLVRLFCGGRP
ncbi:MAG TPA: chemotaxis response regulator protein-glutamate methylesterase [Xanthobacteraceae bacterium]